jgi:hypothetical protein
MMMTPRGQSAFSDRSQEFYGALLLAARLANRGGEEDEEDGGGISKIKDSDARMGGG